MKIENYGVGHRCAAVLSLLLSYCEQNPPGGVGRIVILPIPTSRDGVHISGTDRLVSEVSGAVTPKDAVCGYAIPKKDKEMMLCRGARVYDAALDEDFLLKNARLTAEGTLGHILTSSKKSPKPESRCSSPPIATTDAISFAAWRRKRRVWRPWELKFWKPLENKEDEGSGFYRFLFCTTIGWKTNNK